MSPATAQQRLLKWLLAPKNRGLAVDRFVESFAAKLQAEGVPVARMTTSVLTMHPEVFVQNVRWLRTSGAAINEVPHSVQQTSDYVRSPVEAIRNGRGTIRVRLTPGVELPYPQLEEVRSQGFTDYVILPLFLSNQRGTYWSCATDDPAGFSDDALELLEELCPAVAMHLEFLSSAHATRSLLTLYLGHHAADRVLSGQFLRGTGEELDAAILFCDMRGFSTFSDSAPMRTVVATLDAYFERLAAPIASHGGEILKFIGDAVLAVFPVADDPKAACAAAFEAAVQGIAAVTAQGDELAAAGGPRLRAGVGLHLGRVLYGNIGAQQRLDFTVIGPAVNEAARIESLCKALQEPVLLSDDFARLLARAKLRSVGRHALKGIKNARELYAPAAGPAP